MKKSHFSSRGPCQLRFDMHWHGRKPCKGKIQMVAGVRLCQKHRALVAAIVADAARLGHNHHRYLEAAVA